MKLNPYFVYIKDVGVCSHGSGLRYVRQSDGLSRLAVMGDSVGEFPLNFSWVIEDELCALGFPGTPENMQYLVNNNVGYLVSLTAERCPDIQGYEKDLHLTCIKIVDFTPPTLQQTEVFLQMMEKARKNKKAVAIHCAHGKGRTGTMAACYLIKQYGYTTRQAIDKIRQIRPGSIETKDQELFVHQFEEYQNTRWRHSGTCSLHQGVLGVS